MLCPRFPLLSLLVVVVGIAEPGFGGILSLRCPCTLRNTCSFKPWCFGMGSWWSMLGVWLRNLSGNSNNIQLFDLHNQSGPGSGNACQQWPDRLSDGNVLMLLCMDGRRRLLPSLVSTCGKNSLRQCAADGLHAYPNLRIKLYFSVARILWPLLMASNCVVVPSTAAPHP